MRYLLIQVSTTHSHPSQGIQITISQASLRKKAIQIQITLTNIYSKVKEVLFQKQNPSQSSIRKNHPKLFLTTAKRTKYQPKAKKKPKLKKKPKKKPKKKKPKTWR